MGKRPPNIQYPMPLATLTSLNQKHGRHLSQYPSRLRLKSPYKS